MWGCAIIILSKNVYLYTYIKLGAYSSIMYIHLSRHNDNLPYALTASLRVLAYIDLSLFVQHEGGSELVIGHLKY